MFVAKMSFTRSTDDTFINNIQIKDFLPVGFTGKILHGRFLEIFKYKTSSNIAYLKCGDKPLFTIYNTLLKDKHMSVIYRNTICDLASIMKWVGYRETNIVETFKYLVDSVTVNIDQCPIDIPNMSTIITIADGKDENAALEFFAFATIIFSTDNMACRILFCIACVIEHVRTLRLNGADTLVVINILNAHNTFKSVYELIEKNHTRLDFHHR